MHLAGETGGTSEEAGLGTNVLGTRRLLRYVLDRGCKKIVLASSIAAYGCLHPDFVPQRLPMLPTDPCQAQDAYGLSKYLMESMASYFARTHRFAEIVGLRFGWVMYSSRSQMPWCEVDETVPLPFLYLGQVSEHDVMAGIEHVLRSPSKPGHHLHNLVGPDIRSKGHVADFLRHHLGGAAKELQITAYEQPGSQCTPIYSMDSFEQDYGFKSTHSVCVN